MARIKRQRTASAVCPSLGQEQPLPKDMTVLSVQLDRFSLGRTPAPVCLYRQYTTMCVPYRTQISGLSGTRDWSRVFVSSQFATGVLEVVPGPTQTVKETAHGKTVTDTTRGETKVYACAWTKWGSGVTGSSWHQKPFRHSRGTNKRHNASIESSVCTTAADVALHVIDSDIVMEQMAPSMANRRTVARVRNEHVSRFVWTFGLMEAAAASAATGRFRTDNIMSTQSKLGSYISSDHIPFTSSSTQLSRLHSQHTPSDWCIQYRHPIFDTHARTPESTTNAHAGRVYGRASYTAPVVVTPNVTPGLDGSSGLRELQARNEGVELLTVGTDEQHSARQGLACSSRSIRASMELNELQFQVQRNAAADVFTRLIFSEERLRYNPAALTYVNLKHREHANRRTHKPNAHPASTPSVNPTTANEPRLSAFLDLSLIPVSALVGGVQGGKAKGGDFPVPRIAANGIPVRTIDTTFVSTGASDSMNVVQYSPRLQSCPHVHAWALANTLTVCGYCEYGANGGKPNRHLRDNGFFVRKPILSKNKKSTDDKRYNLQLSQMFPTTLPWYPSSLCPPIHGGPAVDTSRHIVRKRALQPPRNTKPEADHNKRLCVTHRDSSVANVRCIPTHVSTYGTTRVQTQLAQHFEPVCRLQPQDLPMTTRTKNKQTASTNTAHRRRTSSTCVLRLGLLLGDLQPSPRPLLLAMRKYLPADALCRITDVCLSLWKRFVQCAPSFLSNAYHFPYHVLIVLYHAVYGIYIVRDTHQNRMPPPHRKETHSAYEMVGGYSEAGVGHTRQQDPSRAMPRWACHAPHNLSLPASDSAVPSPCLPTCAACTTCPECMTPLDPSQPLIPKTTSTYHGVTTQPPNTVMCCSCSRRLHPWKYQTDVQWPFLTGRSSTQNKEAGTPKEGMAPPVHHTNQCVCIRPRMGTVIELVPAFPNLIGCLPYAHHLDQFKFSFATVGETHAIFQAMISKLRDDSWDDRVHPLRHVDMFTLPWRSLVL